MSTEKLSLGWSQNFKASGGIHLINRKLKKDIFIDYSGEARIMELHSQYWDYSFRVGNIKSINKIISKLLKFYKMKKTNLEIREILRHSNFIEREYSNIALEDALRAWKYAKANIDKIDVEYILTIHYLLMRRIRPDIAGKIRTCDVWIGGQLKTFISEHLIKSDLMMKVVYEMLANIIGDIEKKAKDVHIAFEYIHPFEDGNGRVGRILYQIHRLKLGLQLKMITGPAQGAEMTQDQIEYYKLFK